MLAFLRSSKISRPSSLRVGRAEWIAATLIAVALGSSAWCAAQDRAAASIAPSAAARAATGAASAPVKASAKIKAKAPAFKPEKENRSLASVVAFLRATHWGKSYGQDEEAEEFLYAQSTFASGAYVAESKVFKGYVCLVQGGEDGCEPDRIAAVVWGASETRSNAEGIPDVVSLAAFDEACAATRPRCRDAAARTRAAGS